MSYNYYIVIRRLFPRSAVPLFVLLICSSIDAQQTPLQVTVLPSSIYPGDVVRVDVAGVGTFSASVFGKQIKDGLIGVDLDTKPGAYPLNIATPQGRVATVSLRILPKAFPVRRLSVPPGFVNPAPEELGRISREFKTTEGIFHSASARKWRGPFLLPVDGTPNSNFGTRSYYNGRRRSPHAGVDFVGAPGTPIRAANHGVIALAEPLYFTGNTVIVDYGGGLYSLFAHLSEFKVKSGDTVAPDTVVGLVGATGRVTGPHLHWSVRLQGARVDPLSLVAATKRQTQ